MCESENIDQWSFYYHMKTKFSFYLSSRSSTYSNKVSVGKCIYFCSGTITMSYANIIHNKCPSTFGIIYVSGEGPIKMIYSIYYI